MNRQSGRPGRHERLYLTAEDHGRQLTLDEYLTSDVREGHRYEIVEGRLEVFPFPEPGLECLRDRVRKQLDKQPDLRRASARFALSPGTVFVSEDPDAATILRPDVACYDQLSPAKPFGQRQWQDVAAFLVVEVVDPAAADKDLVRNPRLYLQVPTIREYWIIDTRQSWDRPTLLVRRREGDAWRELPPVGPDDEYQTDLFPGLALVVGPRRDDCL